MTDDSVLGNGGSDGTPSTWLDRVRGGDGPAWETFVRVYSPLIYHWCRRCGLQQADAADVGQQVFEAVFGAIRGFRREKDGAFRGWLRTITRNKVRDFVQDRTKTLVAGGDARDLVATVAAPAPDDTPDPDEERILFRRALDLVLDGCHEKSRQAFLRVVIGQQDPAVVAEDLGLTAGAVYSVRSRVLRQLREKFADLIDPDAGPPPPADPEAT